MSTTESELKKAVRDAEERVQILREKLLDFTANIKYDDQSHTVPASDNEEWNKVSTELEEATQNGSTETTEIGLNSTVRGNGVEPVSQYSLPCRCMLNSISTESMRLLFSVALRSLRPLAPLIEWGLLLAVPIGLWSTYSIVLAR